MRVNASYYTAEQLADVHRIEAETYKRLAKLPSEDQRKWAKSLLDTALGQAAKSRGCITGRIVVMRALIHQAISVSQGKRTGLESVACQSTDAILAKVVGATYGCWLAGRDVEEDGSDDLTPRLIEDRDALDNAHSAYIDRVLAETHE